VGSRSGQRGLYRQSIQAIELSLERSTPKVPGDGYFYVLLGGEIKGKFRNKGDALKMYKALLDASGYKPEPPARPRATTGESVEQYLDDLESYWDQSHRFQKRGGKGRY